MQNKGEVYAGFLIRAFAFLIDWVLVGIASLIVKGAAMAFASRIPISLDNIVFNFGFADICAYIATVVYFVITTRYNSGKTLGKLALGIEVINADGTRAGFWKLLYRETVGRYLSAILCIGYIMAAFSDEKKALHDILSDTRVVFSARRVEVPTQKSIASAVTAEPEPQAKSETVTTVSDPNPESEEEHDDTEASSETDGEN